MKETKEEKTEQKQSGNKTAKTLLGTDEEKGVWEKAAETIAGDNKLMGTVLKLILSPITLLVGVGFLIYAFIKLKGQKDEIEKLKAENIKLKEDYTELEEDFEKVKKKYKKIKTLTETESESPLLGIGITNHKSIMPINQLEKKKTYETAYL
jgi:cell division protein FtsB